MIVRMTLRDNAYSHWLRMFCSNLNQRLLEEQLTLDEVYSVMQVMTSSFYDKPRQEDLEVFIYVVKHSFDKFVSKYKSDVAAYLYDKFEISAVTEMRDTSENGEVVYYFTRSNTCVTQ